MAPNCVLPNPSSKAATTRPLAASEIFPRLRQELEKDPSLAGGLKGLFIIQVLQDKGETGDAQEWYMLFTGVPTKPTITSTRPELPLTSAKPLPIVLLQLKDEDLVRFCAGGLSGMQGIVSGRIKVGGDIDLALGLERLFVQAGGPERTLEILRSRKGGYGQQAKL
ncbi:hypothetical protein YB2330_005310 [Saitoella coloradoensis]